MKTTKRHINIPIFIPHLGCPNACVFCDQRIISGRSTFDPANIRAEIDTALSTISPGAQTEIAFFGGSFTGIDRELMITLLDTAKEYVDAGKVESIRLSTRPDYINSEILAILKEYPVGVIELGIQSMDDRVLAASKRGHTAADTEKACRQISGQGFDFVGQMMVGLPGADGASEIATAEAICRLGAAAARVYPTVVFRSTELAKMVEDGQYIPLDADTAVERTRDVLAVFVAHELPVIRVGLSASENLSSDMAITTGAAHAAIGELAMGALYYDIIARELKRHKDLGSSVLILVPRGEISKAVGQKKINRTRLMAEFGLREIIFREETSQRPYEVILKDKSFKR